MSKVRALCTGLLPGLLAASPVLADWELNMPKGVTELSREIYGLHMLIFWVCVAIAVVVFGALIYSIATFRKSKGAVPAGFSHSTKVEIIWTAVPIVILVAMALPAADTLIKMEDTRDPDVTVKVTGYQWKWHYEYLADQSAGVEQNFGFYSTLDAESNRARQLDSGIDVTTVPHYLRAVDNPLVVPVGKKVRMLITSNDVIHAWWVPELARKKDAIPGFINEFWFKIDEPGTYRGQCAELCGRDHGFMPVVVVAKSEADFADWVGGQLSALDAPAGEPAVSSAGGEDGEALPVLAAVGGAARAVAASMHADTGREKLLARGRDVYAANCVGCHQTDGAGLKPVFPALAGSPTVTGEPAEVIDVVLNGRPGTTMQGFGASLSDEDVAAVITFVRNAWNQPASDAVQPEAVRVAR